MHQSGPDASLEPAGNHGAPETVPVRTAATSTPAESKLSSPDLMLGRTKAGAPAVAELIGVGSKAGSPSSSFAQRAASSAVRLASRAVLRTLVRLDGDREARPASQDREASRVRGPEARRARSARDGNAGHPQAVLVPLRTPANAANRLRDRPRILLLNPPRFHGIPVTRLFRSEYLFVQGNQVPAMDLAYFAAVARDRAHVCIVEASGEDLTLGQVLERCTEFRPDVIVQKGVLNVLHHDLAASAEYKRNAPHVKVVLSCRGAVGAETEVFAEFPFVDAIARGEIDAFAADIAASPDLNGIEGLSLPDRVASTIRVVEDLDEHPIPAIDLMPRRWYSGFGLSYYGVPSGYFLTSSRGCPYTCTFCMVGGIDGRPFRHRRRSPDNVAEEARLVRRDYGIRDYYVFDEIFTMPGHAERVAEAWLSQGTGSEWICEGKPDLVTAPMLSTMKRAGCLAVYYGVESGDDGILREVEKGHDAEDARRAISLTRAAGILAGAYVMLGFPGETFGTYLRTARLLFETKPDLLRYDFLLPYPVTVLHREMVAAGLLEGGHRELDRRISPHHDERLRFRSQALGPFSLRAMEFLLKQGFARELRSSPLPSMAGP